MICDVRPRACKGVTASITGIWDKVTWDVCDRDETEDSGKKGWDWMEVTSGETRRGSRKEARRSFIDLYSYTDATP